MNKLEKLQAAQDKAVEIAKLIEDELMPYVQWTSAEVSAMDAQDALASIPRRLDAEIGAALREQRQAK